MRISAILALFLTGFLTGCGNFGALVPGQSTKLDVRARLGAPTEIRSDRNGDELWEYARGPEGFETHLVRMGADGKVKELTQLITQERLMSIVPGTMTRQDVRHLLGRPSDQTMTGVGEVWSWRYLLNGLAGYLFVGFNPDGSVRDRGVLIDAINYDSP